jgi:putative NADPH-quinone reductase
MTRILLIDGHPDPDAGHFIHALADAYRDGAEKGGHDVRQVRVADLDFPILRSQREWKENPVPRDIAAAQQAITWAEHLVFLYPMWLGDVPALMKGFLEQVARPHFAFRYREQGFPEKLLAGRSARIIVTMGMPAVAYSLVYRAHSLKSLERNILRFAGINPVHHTIIGRVEASEDNRQRWLEDIRLLGFEGD